MIRELTPARTGPISGVYRRITHARQPLSEYLAGSPSRTEITILILHPLHLQTRRQGRLAFAREKGSAAGTSTAPGSDGDTCMHKPRRIPTRRRVYERAERTRTDYRSLFTILDDPAGLQVRDRRVSRRHQLPSRPRQHVEWNPSGSWCLEARRPQWSTDRAPRKLDVVRLDYTRGRRLDIGSGRVDAGRWATRQETSSRWDRNGDGFRVWADPEPGSQGTRQRRPSERCVWDGPTFIHHARRNRLYLERGRDRATISAVSLLGSFASDAGLNWLLVSRAGSSII